MGADDDGIAALDRIDSLDHRGRFRVGGRRQRTDHANGLGNLDDVALLVFLDDTHGLVGQDVHQRGAGLDENLGEFAVVVTELGLVEGVLGDHFRNTGLGTGPHHGLHQLVDLFLGVVLDLGLSLASALHQCLDVTGGLGLADIFNFCSIAHLMPPERGNEHHYR